MAINAWLALGFGYLGAVFGSFAGATTWRLKHHKDIVKDRSECEHCHRKLTALDLVPIFSWLVLTGRCRYCRKPIGWSALLFELGLGLTFALTYVFWPGGLATGLDQAMFGLWLVGLVLMAILFAYDLKWYTLPDVVMAPLIAVGLAIFLTRAAQAGWSVEQAGLELLLGLLPVTGLYGLLFAVSRGRWVGDSDPILGIFIGLALGWQLALLSVVVANFIGLAAVLPQLVSSRLKAQDQVPFGPSLILATIVCLWWGQALIDWYFGWLVI
ncbi:MAG TPA: prepilin peptidase [Candidatus Saccharimonadales bacterium]|nr:prepilin peptidase [Candidatus Saccharimonadales bacterium]